MMKNKLPLLDLLNNSMMVANGSHIKCTTKNLRDFFSSGNLYKISVMY